MRLIIIFLLLFTYSEILEAQNFVRVDSIVKAYPANYKETKELAEQISEDFQNPKDRVRAVYNWITNHVSYDLGELSQMPVYSYSSEEERISEEAKYEIKVSKRVLRKKKAICSGYSYLFKELCDLLNVECKIVVGNAKNQSSYINKSWTSNHAWNMVTIDGNSYLVDATWGAGHMEDNIYIQDPNYVYFFTAPSILIKNHYPEDYKDALLDQKISKKDFSKAPYLHDITESRYKLISPKSLGVLRANNLIKFSFNTEEDVSKISCLMNGEWFAPMEITQEANKLEFTIDLKGKRGRKLDVYIDHEPVVSYLVRK